MNLFRKPKPKPEPRRHPLAEMVERDVRWHMDAEAEKWSAKDDRSAQELARMGSLAGRRTT